MARYTNASGGLLILPDETEIEAGSTAEVSDVENAGVASWIKDGLLVKVADATKPSKPGKPDKVDLKDDAE